MFLLLWIIRISRAPTSTPTLLLGHTLTYPEHKTLTQQLQEQRTELSSRPEQSNSPLVTINLCLPGATRVADSTWHSVEAAVLRMAVTAFPRSSFLQCASKIHFNDSLQNFLQGFSFFIEDTHVCMIFSRDSLSPYCNFTVALSLQHLIHYIIRIASACLPSAVTQCRPWQPEEERWDL